LGENMNMRRIGLVVLIPASLVGLAYIVGLMILASPPPPLLYALKPYSGKPLSGGGSFNVQEGKLIHKVSPSYPELAREMRWRPPFVNMELNVGKDGRVADAKIIRGHPLCDDAVRIAVSQWKYSPTLLNGTPVPIVSRTSLRCGDPYHGKLDPDVAVLIDRIRRNGAVNPGEFGFVNSGMADLYLTLSDSRKTNMDTLRKLGLVTSGSILGNKLVTGRLPVSSLNALRALPFINFIAPHTRD
jgi:TonB family protein